MFLLLVRTELGHCSTASVCKVSFPFHGKASQVIDISLTRMQKIIPPLLALMIHLALRDLIFMMRKREIYSPRMDVQLLSEHCAVTIISWSARGMLQKVFVKEMQKMIRWNIININTLLTDYSFRWGFYTDLNTKIAAEPVWTGPQLPAINLP